MTMNGYKEFLTFSLKVLAIIMVPLMAVFGGTWSMVKDTRATMHTNTNRIVVSETKVEHNEAGIAGVQTSVNNLDSKFDRKFDALIMELQHARTP